MTRVSNEIMRLFARALDLEEDFFARSIDRHISVLSAMYYPHQDSPPKPGQLRAGAHTDFGTMTILKPDLAPGGLQVQSKSGEWLPVRAPSGTLVVNIGDMMARWTNDRWVSTLHRVVNPPADIKVGTERLSIGFFHHPNYDALIECLPSCQDAELGVKHTPGNGRRSSLRSVFLAGSLDCLEAMVMIVRARDSDRPLSYWHSPGRRGGSIYT